MRTERALQGSIAEWMRGSLVLQIAVVAVAYLACARFAIAYALDSTGAMVLWLPNAVVLSAMLLTRTRAWWRFALTQMMTELLVQRAGLDPLQSLVYAVGNLLEVLLCAALIRRFCGRDFAFANAGQVALFAGIAMGLAPGVMAFLGTWVHCEAASASVSFIKHWQIWWIGDGMGMVVLTPLLFGWLQWPRPAQQLAQTTWSERLLFVVVLGALVLLLFYDIPDPHSPWVGSPLLMLPLFLWAALRLGIAGVSLLGCLVSLLAIVLTSQGRGMFSMLDASMQTQLLQQYLAALLLSSLAVAAVVNDLAQKYLSLAQAERKLESARVSLTELNLELEARVAQRTAELERLATTDSLTDAYNRRFLMTRADIEIALARRQSHALSMVMFDIDHFKRINDSHGHNVGDRVLVALSQTVKIGLRQGDTFARVGGEEFVLLLPHSDAEQALLVAQRLRAAVEEMKIRIRENLLLQITASFGVATMDGQTQTVDALYVAADTALYRAKAAGRNRVVSHSPAPARLHPANSATPLLVVKAGGG